MIPDDSPSSEGTKSTDPFTSVNVFQSSPSPGGEGDDNSTLEWSV